MKEKISLLFSDIRKSDLLDTIKDKLEDILLDVYSSFAEAEIVEEDKFEYIELLEQLLEQKDALSLTEHIFADMRFDDKGTLLIDEEMSYKMFEVQLFLKDKIFEDNDEVSIIGLKLWLDNDRNFVEFAAHTHDNRVSFAGVVVHGCLYSANFKEYIDEHFSYAELSEKELKQVCELFHKKRREITDDCKLQYDILKTFADIAIHRAIKREAPVYDEEDGWKISGGTKTAIPVIKEMNTETKITEFEIVPVNKKITDEGEVILIPVTHDKNEETKEIKEIKEEESSVLS